MIKHITENYQGIEKLKNARFAKQNDNTLFFLKIVDKRIKSLGKSETFLLFLSGYIFVFYV